jgi:hypothetical protein
LVVVVIVALLVGKLTYFFSAELLIAACDSESDWLYGFAERRFGLEVETELFLAARFLEDCCPAIDVLYGKRTGALFSGVYLDVLLLVYLDVDDRGMVVRLLHLLAYLLHHQAQHSQLQISLVSGAGGRRCSEENYSLRGLPVVYHEPFGPAPQKNICEDILQLISVFDIGFVGRMNLGRLFIGEARKPITKFSIVFLDYESSLNEE